MHTLLLQIGPMLCTARNFAELKKLACTVKSLCACQCPKRVQVCDIHTGVHQFDQHCEVTAQCSDETRVAVFVAVFLDRVGGEQVGVVGGALESVFDDIIYFPQACNVCKIVRCL